METKWALIDCNLPKGKPLDDFFKLVESLKINRLDLVCLTHPHDDHYTGMEAILRYFTNSGRSVGTFCDCGTEPREIHTLLGRRNRPHSAVQEYERLYRYVYELMNSGKIIYFRADENCVPLMASGNMKLIPVGPRPDIVKLAVKKTISSGKIRTDLNRLSVVLALLVRSSNEEFDALLAADTDADGFQSAMESLKTKTERTSIPLFNVLKVAHHGSIDSHRGSGVHKYKKATGEAVAAISAGHFDVLPDREVMRDFITHNWTVLLTTKRLKSHSQHAIELFGKSPQSQQIQTHNIKITWSEGNGLKWAPQGALVDVTELGNYQTAN